jgi:LysR family cys regulon transcriptional activator
LPSLQQLEALCAIVSNGFNISAAAQALGRSQPTLSRQVQDIERALGGRVFTRTRNRVVALTPIGEEILRISQRMVRDAGSLTRVAAGEVLDGTGELKIATTHLHARYSLPRVMKDFAAKFSGVALALRQGDSIQCCQLVASGEADIGVTTLTAETIGEVVAIPAYKLPRCVVAPRDHPITREKTLTLKKLAQYPIVVYCPPFSARWIVEDAFTRASLKPRIVCSAIDADVIKTYVEIGMGIAVLATIAFDRRRDRGLAAVRADHLFRPGTVNLVIRKYGYLSRNAREFISLFAPHIDAELIQTALEGSEFDRSRLVREAPIAAFA